ncbi:DUF1932 domain-containing protein [Aliiroseovarius sp.]|uniref:NAD(P)-dependent oxidoreductase n=1 Tax=Aliiroseovarius sp. TaxID=1872442 RepID=UPI003BAB2C63
MTPLRIGMIGMGEMGAALAGAFRTVGHHVHAQLAGRSTESRNRAAEAGVTEVGSLHDLVTSSDILFSVLPTQHAKPVAQEVAVILAKTGCRPHFVEANAIAPGLVNEIAVEFLRLGVTFLDGGLIGPPPSAEGRPRLYACGQDLELLHGLDGSGFTLVELAGPIGQASAFKTSYAAMTKGVNALLCNVMLGAQAHGFLSPFLDEIANSQTALADRARANIPRLPCDAARWQDEMLQIARSFADIGLPGAFHQGAAEVMALLAASPYGTETRRTRDRSRDLKSTISGVTKARVSGGKLA